VTRRWRMFRNEELYNLYSLPDILKFVFYHLCGIDVTGFLNQQPSIRMLWIFN
jgi:hypothetical protein